jgi:hypothetical protein
MEKLVIAAVLACQPGDSLIDWSGKFPRGPHVTVNPFYSFSHLQTRLSSKHPAMLQQQADVGDPRGGRRRSILHWTKPTANEMDRARPFEAGP